MNMDHRRWATGTVEVHTQAHSCQMDPVLCGARRQPTHNVGKVAAGPGFALAEEWCLRRRRASSTNLLATLLSIRPSAERRAFPALLELTYA